MISKRICHLTSVHPVLDDRILFKECMSLRDAGYEVVFVVPNVDGQSFSGIQILELPVFKGRLKRLLLGSIAAFRFAMRSKAQLIHFHDPELMPVGVLLRLCGRKVVYDVHENIVQQIRYKPWLNPRMLRHLLSGIIWVVEKFCCLFFNGIVAATDEIAEKFVPVKTTVVRNFPILKWSQEIHYERLTSEVPCIVYAGGLTEIRGIREIIQALPLLHRPIKFMLIGRFDEKSYEQECRSLEGWQYVDYKGFMPLKEVYRHVASADIGIAMLYPIENYLGSLPVKAFEYMAFGLPMILSDFPFWKKLFGECALFANPHHSKEIAKAILKLLEDKDLCDRLGARGKEMVQQEMNWETESHRLLTHYKRVLHED